MGDLKIGDALFAPNGEICRVIFATEVMHGHDCYCVEFSDGERIVADAEHLWVTDARRDRDRWKNRGKNSGPKPRLKTTKEIATTLMCRNEINHRIPLPQAFDREDQPLTIDPYVLGIWLGDGTTGTANITIGDQDAADFHSILAARGQELSKCNAPLRYKLGYPGRVRKPRSNTISSRLRAMGILYAKQIPPIYLRGSYAQRLALLQGLMDTDGACDKRGRCELTTTSEVLAAQIRELLWGLGFKPAGGPSDCKLYGRTTGTRWRITFTPRIDRPVFLLKRKVARQQPKGPFTKNTRQIRTCERVPSVPVRCIQVDHPSQMYLCGASFVPTHNTTIISLALPLQAVAYGRKSFILLIGESGDTAQENLASVIKEVENNELLLEDFPHLAAAKDNKGHLVKWTDRQLVFQSGATIMAKGTGMRLRGLKRGQFRPDLAIIDDPESPETADTYGKRKKVKRWFGGTFMGLGAADWDIYVIGNLIQRECLVADLLLSPEWDGKVYRAENTAPRPGYPFPLGNTKADGTALWPAGLPHETLAMIKRQPNVGSSVYATEYMNDPREDGDRAFSASQFAYFDYTPAMLADYDSIATFIDPAGGQKPGEAKQGKKDFAAIVTAGRRKDNRKIQILDVRLTKELPAKQIDLLLDVYRDFRPSRVGAEDNMFKNLLKPNIEERAKVRQLYPPVIAVHQTQNKVTRILSIQPPIEAKTIEFARHLLKTCTEYFEQFDEFRLSGSVHDDGPDATEGAVRMLERGIEWRLV